MNNKFKLDGRMFINGERVQAFSNEEIDVIDPSTGEKVATTPAGDAPDVDAAVQNSLHAYKNEWRKVKPLDRANILFNIAKKVDENREELAYIESLDVGKPYRQALQDVDSTIGYFQFYAGLADKVFGTSIPLGVGTVDYTVREPIGVSAQIVPWNYPLQLSSRGFAPALAAGNVVVAKVAEDASLSILRLAEIAYEAGLPKGVLNIVTGYGAVAGNALSEHPDIHHLTFTGSLPTGVQVMKTAANQVTPVNLELGGKSPIIIFDDADIDSVVNTAASVITQNAGQTCSAASRIIVDRRVQDEVVSRIAEKMGAVQLGRGLDNPDMGPVVSERQMNGILKAIEKGEESKAQVVVGGKRSEQAGLENGYFIEPTLFNNMKAGSFIEQEEIFGPVLGVMPFDDPEEALEMANGTKYGLVASVWGNNLKLIHHFTNEIEAGQVFVNGYGAGGGVALPFGGYKKSGFGREKGVEALQNYTTVKNIWINYL
ncbi:aldehyde dehydrogenase family protein [Lentibacillus amyloliquefaciens]|uniref:Aldehyde dehydrogenase n=1 Tax=Lentibacillus amyloliquefaciens TaxID=1472767 RepID=A0A0U4FP13_9BACI|nr:aldehyde dehydrogenase family protein [Lentibacillus amyloliquefaciens]ALX47573.1 aldehyde dehydrogenase [Lentibacillus amyloliquefaciens]